MESVIKLFEDHSDFLYAGKGCSEDKISQAEHTLGTRFAPDYRECLRKYGIFVFEGHEFAGITDVKRVSVTDVTRMNRALMDDIPDDWYVLEETNIDGIIVWQSPDGTVYISQPRIEPVRVAKNLNSFITACM